MKTATVPGLPEQRVILTDVSWQTYVALANDSLPRSSRMAYDHGVLEIMSPSRVHERTATRIGRLIETFTEVLEIEIESTGSTTFKRYEELRAFESDVSFYIAHADEVRDVDEIDLSIFPPPDLVGEVDLSRSLLGKFPIYQALGVPEVWRFANDDLQVYVLQMDRAYAKSEQSAVLPGFPVTEVPALLAQASGMGETKWIRAFREVIQDRFGAG